MQSLLVGMVDLGFESSTRVLSRTGRSTRCSYFFRIFVKFITTVFLFEARTVSVNQIGLHELPWRCAKPLPIVNASRIAVAFFGLSRNLTATLPSIKRHVFDVLDNSSIAYDVYWHTMAAKVVNNVRTGDHEHGTVDPFDVKLIRPCYFSLIDQEGIKTHEFDKFLKAREINERKFTRDQLKKLDPWSDNFDSMRNILCAFHTQTSLSEMIETQSQTQNISYDAIVALRPDTAVIKDIDLPENMQVIKEQPNSIFIPDFQSWSGYNDRAAYGPPQAMHTYLRRGEEYRDNPIAMPGEKYLHYIVAKYKLELHPSRLRVLRVRQDGKVSNRDLPHMYMNISLSPLDSDYHRCVPNLHTRILSSLC